MTVTKSEGRVARRKRETLGRIIHAAAELFDAQGFDATTTQQISERVDIAAGTLFRYAATKPELLLLVYNERLREALAAAERAMDAEAETTEALLAYAVCILRAAADQPRNTALFQRELIFADADEPYRAEGLALVEEMEHRLCDRLMADLDDQIRAGGAELSATASARLQPVALQAARSIFADLHVLLIQPHRASDALNNDFADLRLQVAMIVDGLRVRVVEICASTPISTIDVKTNDPKKNRKEPS